MLVALLAGSITFKGRACSLVDTKSPEQCDKISTGLGNVDN